MDRCRILADYKELFVRVCFHAEDVIGDARPGVIEQTMVELPEIDTGRWQGYPGVKTAKKFCLTGDAQPSDLAVSRHRWHVSFNVQPVRTYVLISF